MHEVSTPGDVNINDGRENNYKVSYSSWYDDIAQKPNYYCGIDMRFSQDEFKIEKAQMLKELILALHDGDYDFNGWVRLK